MLRNINLKTKMVRYDELVWWVVDYLPSGYSFYVLPEMRHGRRVIIFNKRGVRGKNWILEVNPWIKKHQLKSSIQDTLFGWDGDKYIEFREREWVKDVKTGEVRPLLFDEVTQKKMERIERKRIQKEINKSKRQKQK